MRWRLKALAKSVYNYHNLGVGQFPQGEEKTPFGSGERYNYDRMYMMVSTYDFTNKNVVDLGCNSGWFCLQARLLGSDVTVGIDCDGVETMGDAIKYARKFEKHFRFGLKFVNANLEKLDMAKLAVEYGIRQFDAAFLLSTLHHFENKKRLFESLFQATKDVIFYEDHEFWNDLIDGANEKISVKGDGHRFGWNKDMSWQRKIHSI